MWNHRILDTIHNIASHLRNNLSQEHITSQTWENFTNQSSHEFRSMLQTVTQPPHQEIHQVRQEVPMFQLRQDSRPNHDQDASYEPPSMVSVLGHILEQSLHHTLDHMHDHQVFNNAFGQWNPSHPTFEHQDPNEGGVSESPLDQDILEQLSCFDYSTWKTTVRAWRQKDKSPTPTISSDLVDVELDDTCTICLDTFQDTDTCQDIIELPCMHIFHKSCIHKWFEKSDMCPICRKKVTVQTIESYQEDLQHLNKNHESTQDPLISLRIRRKNGEVVCKKLPSQYTSKDIATILKISVSTQFMFLGNRIPPNKTLKEMDVQDGDILMEWSNL